MAALGMKKFVKNDMVALFQRTGEKLKEAGIYAEIAVYGGSSFMLHEQFFHVRRSTEDVDFSTLSVKGGTSQTLQDILNESAVEMGLEDVYRDSVKDLSSFTPEYDFFDEFPPGDGNFRVYHTSAEYLLSMKAKAMRSSTTTNDPSDFWYLMKDIGITELEEVKAIVDKYYPFEKLDTRNAAIIGDLIEDMQNGLDYNPMRAW